ncbi:VacB/RNase II family 3'-5' exoribonuclease [Haliea atlantica]
MLDSDSLSRLKGLKSQMEAEKERADATVKGTQSRYGFAVLDDGREVFIPPDEMLKVFPDDRVRVCVRPGKDNRTVADIEKLLDSPLADFTGRCVRKGKAIFVQPDLPWLKRWLFIPPHARNGVKEGDYLRAAILRHPIRDGKPQAKVLQVYGNDETPGIENSYCMGKYRLPVDWSGPARGELQTQLTQCSPLQDSARKDLTGLEFVSIDASRTLDIDDALYADSSSEGWTLYVAIADPTAWIPRGSRLEEDIAARATSVYFHGDVLPMLPEELAQVHCALAEGEDRPALVCKLSVNNEGELGEFEFIEATIRSRAKLSYVAVDRYLNGHADELMSHATPLEALYQLYRALRGRREARELVMEDRQEFRWILNDRKQIDHIEPHEKLLSQRLVEECMIAANRCAASFLQRHQAKGPFVVHPGFRNDRLDEARQFLALHAPATEALDLASREGYRDIMRALSEDGGDLPLRAMVNRLLTRAEITTEAGLHMGMSLESYTNCTSPLRKYVDFLAHQQIKAVLRGEPADRVDADMLARLQARLLNVRAATLEAERWLASRYLARLAKDNSEGFPAHITHVNSSGFTVRLDDYGLEGFVDLRKDPEKFSYDKWTASLTSTTRRFQLHQAVRVDYQGADGENQHQAQFGLRAGEGLKPPKGPAEHTDQAAPPNGPPA